MCSTNVAVIVGTKSANTNLTNLNLHRRSALLFLASTLAGLLGAVAIQAQPVFRQSWTLQDKERGLRQELARIVIGRANDFMTHDDPYGATARLDDRLRITVVGELSQSTGLLQTRLERLVMGTVVIEKDFERFLDPPMMDRLVRRDYFWRDETATVYNQQLSPINASSTDSLARMGADPFESLSRETNAPEARIAMNESSLRIEGTGLRLFAGLGNDDLSLPDFSYGRGRVGVISGSTRIWGEVPTLVGRVDNALAARGLDGSFGIGVSFENSWMGGSVAGTLSRRAVGPSPVDVPSERRILDKSALLYGLLPVRLSLAGDALLRVKLGVGFESTVTPIVDATSVTDPARVPHAEESTAKLLARFELATLDDNHRLQQRLSAGFLGGSFLATWEYQFTSLIGVRVAASRHGLFGDRERWLPEYSLSITPTLTIW